jgi:hypothetical protein
VTEAERQLLVVLARWVACLERHASAGRRLCLAKADRAADCASPGSEAWIRQSDHTREKGTTRVG